MGDLQVCSPQPNGVLKEDRLYPPLPSSIVPDCWVTAEQTTQEIVRRIQPTLVSEHKRKEVIDYVQTLIRRRLRCEVFPYGSVPLKTYLPDGDIDLTALSSPDVEDALGCDVFTVLKEEEQNEAAEYELKDVQFIFAEVKLVKCLVQNIVVDISFNQLGGLCTLCFLEQVDRLVGKDHLFKRSIILIKAWCYYESRILGAHHGLISTYALETLVLYIFNLFHSSLNGPLAVLYRFLEYFSKFDWENYCISLNGPVCKSSLPDIEAEIPENGGDDLLLSEEFLRNCVDMFSVPSRALETNSRAFPQKHLNIIDPLKENNNLGRSVNRGNFYRICSAFKYGARKLGRILLSPRERIADELKKFFANTLESHGSKFSTDVQNYVLTSGAKGYGPSSLSSHPETCSEDKMVLESSNVDFGNTNISGMKDKLVSRIRNEPERCSMEVVSSQTLSETDCSTDGNAVSGYRLAGDANNLVTSTFLSSRITNDTSDCSPPSSDLGTSLSGKSHYAPHLYFSGSSTEDGKLENGNSENTAGFIFRLEPKENHSVASNTVHACSNHEGMTTNGSAISSPVANVSEDLSFDIREMDLAAISGSHEASKSLANLSGDYNSHIRSLLYGQCCHGYALSAPVLPSLPISPSQFRNKKLWDMCRRSLQVKRNFSSQRNTNGVVLGPPFFPVNHTTLSSAAFGLEEKQKPRGTGTYIPNTNCHPCKGRLSPGRGRNQSPGTESQLQRHTRNNGLATARPETNLFEEDSHELLRVQYPVLGCGKFGSTDLHQSHPSMSGSSHANGPSLPSERLEFGSLGHLPSGVPLPKRNSLPDSGTPGCAPSLLAPVVQSPRLVLGNNPERVAGESYHLKDEDFPPLSL